MNRELFGTDGVRGKANHYPMTPELVLKLGKAIALHFEKKGVTPKIVIGKDTRLSGYLLETALTSGLVSMGATVCLVGPVPTPAVSYLARTLEANAGIMISASHNPAEDNRIKLFDSKGYKLSDSDEYSIEQILFSPELNNGFHDGRSIGKAFRVEDAQQRYREFAKSTIAGVSLKGIKAVIDCANGAGYKVAPQIFSELGVQVVAIHNQPDGSNINLECGATHIKSLSAKVVEEKANIGIALDGDADRVIVVNSSGEEVDGDRIMAALAKGLNERKKLVNSTIVATIMSNAGFEKHMNENGISVVRTKVGDRYVIEEMLRSGSNFGGEQSGHIIFGDYSTTGDGIITALQVLCLMKEHGKSVAELCNSFKLYPQVITNLKVKEKIPFEQLPKVSAQIKLAEKELNGSGKVLVRYSGTENILRIMVEGESEIKIRELAENISANAKEEIGFE